MFPPPLLLVEGELGLEYVKGKPEGIRRYEEGQNQPGGSTGKEKWGSGRREREGQCVHREGEIKGRKRPESNKIVLAHEREMRLRKLWPGE